MSEETRLKDELRGAKAALHRVEADARAVSGSAEVGDSVLVYVRGAWRPAEVTRVRAMCGIEAARTYKNGSKSTARWFAWYEWARS